MQSISETFGLSSAATATAVSGPPPVSLSISESFGLGDAAGNLPPPIAGPCVYYSQDAGGNWLAPLPHTTSPGGPVIQLVYMGPTRGNEWQYSGMVNGITTMFVTHCGPTIGRQRSPT